MRGAELYPPAQPSPAQPAHYRWLGIKEPLPLVQRSRVPLRTTYRSMFLP